MPEYPTPGEDWTTWIIGTLMAVLSAVVTTATYLARMIGSKYENQVADLHKSVEQLSKESKECQQDRLALSIRVASLEASTKQNKSDISDIRKHE